MPRISTVCPWLPGYCCLTLTNFTVEQATTSSKIFTLPKALNPTVNTRLCKQRWGGWHFCVLKSDFVSLNLCQAIVSGDQNGGCCISAQREAKSAADACANLALEKECVKSTKYLFNEMPIFSPYLTLRTLRSVRCSDSDYEAKFFRSIHTQ